MPKAMPKGFFEAVSPVLLASSCDVLENNSAIPNYADLAYPFRRAIVVDEIRWTLRNNYEGSSSNASYPNLGSIIYVKMSLGRHLLMRDPVPMWILGTAMDIAQEEVTDNSTSQVVSISQYRWRLPQPLYVEAGEVLRSTFSRGIDDNQGTINVQVAYAGRTVAPNKPVPGLISVPYAAPFVTTLGNSYQLSNEKHLFNMFDKPLRVQRMTGRVLQMFNNGADFDQLNQKVSVPTLRTVSTDVNVKIHDSWGGKIVNNQVGPSDVFDIKRCSWTFDTDMPPKGVYIVEANNIDAGTAEAVAESLHIAMIGSREETP